MKKTIVIEPFFTDIPLIERIKKFADLEFDGIEFWDCSKENAKELGDEAANYNLEVTGCIAKGLFDGHLNRSYKDVKKTFLESLEYMRLLRCTKLLIFPGNVYKNEDTQKSLVIENLKKLAVIAKQEGVTIFIEAINNIIDHKGHYLVSTAIAAEIARCVDHENVRLIFDIYHMQVMEGNIINNIKDHIDLISHFHSAGLPGRCEHHLGELDYPKIIEVIKELEYEGYFGLEYLPSYDNEQSIKDVLEYLGI
jgi:hydroxypyruvate isomerase